MKWLVLLLLVVGCTETTAPTVDCRGELIVTTTQTRWATDTAVVCDFPRDTLPPPCDDDDEEHHHGHDHHHHGGHR